MTWNDLKPLQTLLVAILGGAATVISTSGFTFPATGQQWATFLVAAAVAGGVLHLPAPRNQAPGILPTTAPVVAAQAAIGADPTHALSPKPLTGADAVHAEGTGDWPRATTSGGAVDPVRAPKPPGAD
jgi:hypothetical protein